MGRFIDLTGQRFGRLTVIKETGRAGNGAVLWLCRCECGKQSIVQGYALLSGNTTSCGCKRHETAHLMEWYQRCKRSGRKKKTRLYNIWMHIKDRCCNPRSIHYPNYGERGIRVCDEWMHSFSTFQEWALSHGYADNLTFDRINNDGDYTPENCRWVNMKVQSNNRRNSNMLTFQGQTKTLAQWADIYRINWNTLFSRIRAGWPVERALTEPVHKKKTK